MILRFTCILFLLLFLKNEKICAISSVDSKILKSFSHTESTIYKIIGNDTLDMLFFYPDNHTKQSSSPVMLYTHGGGWGGGDKYKIFRAPFLETLRTLLNNNIVCVSIEYRLTRNGISNGMDCV